MSGIKLHLGCGEQYKKGYVNIDYPPDHHTVQRGRVDKYADLKELEYPDGSVEEIRLHHVFEHFSRQWALLLLSRWHRWLESGGRLVIETPDFDGLAKCYVETEDMAYRFKLLRHIFGSHEAHWAFHYDGWGEDKFRFVLSKFGFGDFSFEKTLAYHSRIGVPKVGGAINKTPFEGLKDATGDRLPNITVIARKKDVVVDYPAVIRGLLEMSVVGREYAMFAAWLKDIGMQP